MRYSEMVEQQRVRIHERRQQVLHGASEWRLLETASAERHRALCDRRGREFVDRVEYWHVHDLDPGAEYDPLTEIETSIESLILDLS